MNSNIYTVPSFPLCTPSVKPPEKAGVAEVMGDKTAFRTEKLCGDKGRSCEVGRGGIGPSGSLSSPSCVCVQQWGTKTQEAKGCGQIYCDTETPTPLSVMDRSDKQKGGKDTDTLNSTILQLHLTDVCRTLDPTMTKYTSSCGTLTRTHHIFWAIK
jgi:hypothetical protein